MRDASLHHFGFVMEQTLGHVTHYRNMRATIDAESGVSACWYPLAFPPCGTLETLPLLRSNWSIRASVRARRTLAHDADRYDALFFHTQVTALLCGGVMRRIPSVISLDATPINYDAVGAAYGHQRTISAFEGIKNALNRRALHSAGALVTWCDWARRSLIEDYGVDGARITVIPPGVDLNLWPRPMLREGGDPIQLLFVGADFARKGGDVLLNAFHAGRSGRYVLHVVTKAPVEPAPDIHVYRDVAPNSDLLKRLYAMADIFVLPTLADCFPLVVQEAMAMGLPVIATNVGAIAEAVHDRETGLLVPPGDAHALRVAIDSLAGDATRRQAMGMRARVLAEKRFDSTANARRILGIMTAVMHGQNQSTS